MKKCRKCGVLKPLSEFYKQKTTSDGHGSYCKLCGKVVISSWEKKNPEKRKAHMRRGRLRYKFGISEDEYQELLQRQGSGCAICGRVDDSVASSMPVDHCHRSGKVRGILCRSCNVGLGMFRDDPELLRAAAAYIDQHSAVEGEGAVG